VTKVPKHSTPFKALPFIVTENGLKKYETVMLILTFYGFVFMKAGGSCHSGWARIGWNVVAVFLSLRAVSKAGL